MPSDEDDVGQWVVAGERIRARDPQLFARIVEALRAEAPPVILAPAGVPSAAATPSD
jgi:hypothetical protein